MVQPRSFAYIPSINQRSTLCKVSSMWQTCCALKWSKFHCYLRLLEGKSSPKKATSHMKREAAKYRVVYPPFPIPAMWFYYTSLAMYLRKHTRTHTHTNIMPNPGCRTCMSPGILNCWFHGGAIRTWSTWHTGSAGHWILCSFISISLQGENP